MIEGMDPPTATVWANRHLRGFRIFAAAVLAVTLPLVGYVAATQPDSAGDQLGLVAFAAAIAAFAVATSALAARRHITVTPTRITATGRRGFDIAIDDIAHLEHRLRACNRGSIYVDLLFWGTDRRSELATLDTRGYPHRQLVETLIAPLRARGVTLDRQADAWTIDEHAHRRRGHHAHHS